MSENEVAKLSARILVAEDESIIAQDIRVTLRRLGYEVPAVVSTGDEALRAMEEVRPDLVLMDIRLRGDMDGVESAIRIRKRFGTPVVYLTAHSDEDTLQRAKESSPYGFILKPFEERELHTAIQLALLKHHTDVRHKESEDRFRMFFEFAPDAYFMFDFDGTILDGNLAAETLAGYEREQFLGKNLLEAGLLLPDEIPRVAALIARNREGQPTGPDEFTLTRSDGTRIPIEIRTQPFVIKDKTFVLTIARDISERKRTDDQLRKLSRAVEQSPASVVVTDTAGNIEYVNPKFERLTGYSLDEIKGKNPRILKSGTTSLETYQQLWAAITSGTEWTGELHNRKKNGALYWETASISPVRDGQGGITHFLAVKEDITERKEAEEALRRSEKMYRNLIESANDAIIIFTPDDERVLEVNHKACDLYGFGRQEFIGMSLKKVTQNVQRGEEELRGLLQTRLLKDYETVHFTKTGTPLNIQANASVVEYEGEEAILGIFRDVTGRKKAEQELELKNTVLTTQQEASPDAILLVDHNGRIVSCNQQFKEMWRIPKGVAIPGEDEPVLRANVGLVQDEEGFLAKVRYLYEHTKEKSRDEILTKEGRTIDRYSAPVVGSDGKYYGRVWYFRDITERRTSEGALRNSEAQLSNALKIAHLGHWEYDIAGDLFTLNDQFYAVHRTTAEQEGGYTMSSGQFAQRFVHPDDRPRIDAVIRTALESPDPNPTRQTEHRTIYAGGQIGYVAVGICIAKDERGRPVKAFGANQDITEHRKGEEELKKSLSLLQATLQSTADGILVVDNSGRVTDYNDRFTELWRIPEEIAASHDDERLLGHVVNQLKDPGIFIAKVKDLYTNPEATSFDVLEFSDGRVFERYSQPQRIDGCPVGRVWSFRDITKRRRAERTLRESEEQYRNLYESAPIGITSVDREGKFLRCNHSMKQILGYTEEDLRGLTFSDVTHPEDHKIGLSALKELATGVRDTVEIEKRYVRKDGEIIWAKLRISAVRDPATHALVDTVTMVENITAHRHAEEALRESEERHRRLADNSFDVIWTTDLNGRFTYISPSLFRLRGFKPEEEIGCTLKQVLTPESWKLAESRLSKAAVAVAQGRPVQTAPLEMEQPCKDGTTVWTESTVNGMYDATGKPVGFLGVTRDVSERKSAEDALRASEAQLTNAMKIARLAYWKYDVASDLFTLNDQFYAILRTTVDEVGSYTMSTSEYTRRFVHPDDLSSVGIEIQKVMESADPHYAAQMEHRVIYADGDIGYVAVRLHVVKDDGGRTVGWYGANQDITERKRAEEALKESEFYLRKSQSVARIGSFRTDLRKGVWVSSPALDDIFDIDGSFLRDINGWAALVHPEHREEMERYLDEHVLKGHHRFDKEYRIVRHRDRGVCWVHGIGELEFDAQGDVIAMIGTIQDITERKRVEEALAKERNLLRTLIDNIPDRIYVKDDQCRFIINNTAHTHALGAKTPEETFGKTDFDYRPHDLASRYYVDDQHVIQSGQMLADREEQTILPTGENGWLLSTKVPLRDRQGNITGLVGISRDITEAKRSQDRVAMLAHAFSSISESVSITDLEGRILFINDALLTTYGYERTDLLGQSIDTLRPANSPDGLGYEIVPATLQGGWQGELINRRKDGSEFPIFLSTSVLRGEKGEPRGLVGVATDITEKKKAEREIEESSKQMRVLIDTVAEGITFSTSNGRFEVFNPAMEKITGYSKEEANNAADFSLLLYPDPVEHQKAMDGLKQIIADGEAQQVETTIRTKDGTYKTLLVSSSVLRKDGVNLFLSAYRDITQRKQIEESLNRYNRELFHSKQTAEEQAQQLEVQAVELREAREKAIEASRLKSDFLATMSHEIRTPMNGVIGMTGLLLDTSLTREQREYSEIIRNSADALLTIINDILDFSKIEAGKAQLEFIDFDLQRVVEETVDLLAHRAQEKGLEITSFVESNVPTNLSGDPGRLRQVLMNLIGNAVKFTDRGDVSVRVSLGEETTTHVGLHFSVADTGIGIPEEARRLLFQPFIQADGSTTRKYGGTGLGLAISKHLVTLMGGEIDVESEPGRGSIFSFSATFGKLEQPVLKETPGGGLRGLRVLVVDDNETNRKIVHLLVSSWGMRDERAACSREALQMLHNAAATGDAFVLAVLDMEMPEMDGEQLARAIKEDPLLTRTRLVMLTSRGKRPREEIMEAGLSACLSKPVRKSELYNSLVEAIHSAGAADPSNQYMEHHWEKEGGASLSLPLKGVRILVVEDNAINQKVAVRMLEKLGCRPDVASDGLEALKAVETIPYDVVLMDCQMPEMDGYEATERIRRAEGKGRHTCIIAMTANALQGDRERCLAAGMDDYVAKPVEHAELLTVIERNAKVLAALEAAGPGNSPGSPGVESRIDYGVLSKLKLLGDGADPAFLENIIRLFLEDTPRRVESIRKAATSCDAAALKACAHKLRGSCIQLGLAGLADLCNSLEEMAGSSPSSQDVEALVGLLQKQFEYARKELETNYLLAGAES